MNAYCKTRFDGIVFGKVGRGWSFFDASDRPEDPARIGPIYARKDELLADVHRFCVERGHTEGR
jgi:hypothetical protein